MYQALCLVLRDMVLLNPHDHPPDLLFFSPCADQDPVVWKVNDLPGIRPRRRPRLPHPEPLEKIAPWAAWSWARSIQWSLSLCIPNLCLSPQAPWTHPCSFLCGGLASHSMKKGDPPPSQGDFLTSSPLQPINFAIERPQVLCEMRQSVI